MKQEEGLLISTKIKSDNEYRLESETNTSSALSPYFLLLLLLPTPISLFTPNNLLLSYIISQHDVNLKQVVQQQQEQLVALQAIIA